MVMARWKSIRETFQDNWNRVKESKRRSSGKGTDDVYKPRWKLWPIMQFMMKTCMMTESVSNIPCSQTQLSEGSSALSATTSQDDNIVSVFYDENTEVSCHCLF